MNPAVPITIIAALFFSGCGVASAKTVEAPDDSDGDRFGELFQHWLKSEGPRPDSTSRHRPQKDASSPRAKTNNEMAVTSEMGMRVNPAVGRRMFHAGVDLAAPIGKAVRATADGIVMRAGWSGGYGLLVVVRHSDGYETRYAHMSRIQVAPGDTLVKGQVIGNVGSTGRSTGPHLHYEVRRDGQPVNPKAYMNK